MSADLIILVPSRGRPASVARLIAACQETCQARTALFFAFDNDDPWLGKYMHEMSEAPFSTAYIVGPRDTLAGWTNAMARMAVSEAGALASLGDDHVPLTPGWDKLLLDAITDHGGTGIAYGNDLLQGQNLPTAPVISANVAAALGWFCEPSLAHMYVDNVWRDLGQGAGCLHYVPEVVIEHRHPQASKAGHDATYAGSESRMGQDGVAYQQWCRERREQDVGKVRALLS